MKDLRSITSPVNGALSNGPVTEEGKRRSSRNAEKHGIYSNTVLLQNESAESLEALRAQYYGRYAPVDQPESDLVDQMVAAAWRARRYGAVETAAINHKMDSQRATLDATYEDLPADTRTHFAMEQLSTDSPTLQTYSRFQAAQARAIDRAIHNLEFLRKRFPAVSKQTSDPNSTDTE